MSSDDSIQVNRDQANRRVLKWGILATVLAFGFGWALVPFYDVFCEQILGIKPKMEAVANPVCADGAQSRKIRIEFDTSVDANLPWQLSSEQSSMEVETCKPATVKFVARNVGPIGMNGQAIFSTAPSQSAAYLAKTECFCFTQQHLDAGQEREMPVKFMINDQLPDSITTITFRYVFNPVANYAGNDPVVTTPKS